MTKKKKREILWMLILIVFLGIGYVSLRNMTEKAEETEEEAAEVIEILALEVDKIQKFSYYYTDETGEKTLLEFEKQEDVWICPGQEDIELDQSRIQTMLNNVSSLTAVRIISESGENLEEYGLEEPENTFTFEEADGTISVLQTGLQNGTTSDYYLMEQTEGTIYTVSTSFITAFDYSAEDLMPDEEDETEDAKETDE